MQKIFDTVIVGGGIAGLTSAYFLAKAGKTVCVIDSGDGIIKHSSSQMAQGGVAADSNWESHYRDTLKAGKYKNRKGTVKLFCQKAWSAVQWLRDEIAVPFRQEASQEGGHSVRRVWTTGDDTGFQIYKRLFEACKSQKNIIWMHKSHVENIQKCGKIFHVTFSTESGQQEVFASSAVLSTGGIGGLFEYSTNPRNLTGDGLLLAKNLGAELEDLDVIQFHPTGLKASPPAPLLSGEGSKNEAPVFLLTEALRGEGALLLNEKGERFMGRFPQKELESRKTVVKEMLKQKSVFLDLRVKPRPFWESHFPNICNKLKQEGFDITKDLIPVVPTQHFLCGGIKVNLNGETNVKNLFAVGECASTGLHGSNRLASNSLAEAVVFGKRTAEANIKYQISNIKKAATVVTDYEQEGVYSKFNPAYAGQNSKFLSPASADDLQILRQLVQKYLRPDRKEKKKLQKALQNLPDSWGKRVVLLLCD